VVAKEGFGRFVGGSLAHLEEGLSEEPAERARCPAVDVAALALDAPVEGVVVVGDREEVVVDLVAELAGEA